MEELKRYRNSFILLTLISVAGIITGLYLYEYTDFFAMLRGDAETVPITVFDAQELLMLYFDEIRVLAIVFLFGFTLFSPFLASVILLYKGFMTGFSVIYFGIYYKNHSIDKQHFVLISVTLIIILMIYIITGAKAVAFSGSLRYAAPDLPSLLKRKTTGKYLVTFLLLAAFLLMAITLKYSIPLF